MDADLIKNATVADVYKGDMLAATLTRDAGDVIFEYLPDYLESTGAPVAHTLPKQELSQPIRTHNGALLAAKQVSLEEIGFTGSTLAGARRTLNRRHEETEKDLLRG